MCNVYFASGIAKSAVKHLAAYKPNKQINGKEGKGKKRNDSGITLNRPTGRADIYTI